MVRKSWTYARKENREGNIEPLSVASAQVLKEDGRLHDSRAKRGPQYVHEDEVLRVIGSSAGSGSLDSTGYGMNRKSGSDLTSISQISPSSRFNSSWGGRGTICKAFRSYKRKICSDP